MFAEALTQLGENVLINMDKVCVITEDRNAVLNGEVFKLKDSAFKGLCTIDDTGGGTKPLREMATPQWTSVKDDLPPDDKYVEVCTKDGQVYVSSLLFGKFPANIGWWRHLPELPEELRKSKQGLDK